MKSAYSWPLTTATVMLFIHWSSGHDLFVRSPETAAILSFAAIASLGAMYAGWIVDHGSK